MAGRQNKVGLDYFELDCHMDEKVRLIQAEYGVKGFAVFVKLLQEIYGGYGYYCEWNRDRELLFASENGLSGGSLLKDIVSACIKRKLFSEHLYSEFGVLTSTGIQKQYLKATAKRDVVELKKEFLLIDIPLSRKNVVINSISVGRNTNSSVRNEQSREEKSKEDKNNKLCKAEALALFEQLWKMYPCKKGKGQVSDKDKTKLLEIGLEEMTRAINRYKSELEKDKEWRKPQNGSTFFHSGYIDYLDANFEESKTQTKKSSFNNFKHNEYDFDELEKELLSN